MRSFVHGCTALVLLLAHGCPDRASRQSATKNEHSVYRNEEVSVIAFRSGESFVFMPRYIGRAIATFRGIDNINTEGFETDCSLVGAKLRASGSVFPSGKGSLYTTVSQFKYLRPLSEREKQQVRETFGNPQLRSIKIC